MRLFHLVEIALLALAAILFLTPLSCGDDDEKGLGGAYIPLDDDEDLIDNDDDDTADDDDQPPSPYEFAPPPSDEIGIFVAKTGSDANPGTMEQPKLTITAGVELAQQEGKSVFVAQGEYHESVVAEGISLYGGYEAENWQRNIKEYVATIKATEENGVEIGILGNTDIFPVVEGFTVFGGESTEGNLRLKSRGILSTSSIISNCLVYGGKSDDTSYGITASYSTVYNSIIYGCNMENHHASKSISPARTAGISAGNSILINNYIHGGSSDMAYRSHGIKAGTYYMLAINNYIYAGDPGNSDSSSTGIQLYCAEYYYYHYLGLVNNIVDSGTGDLKSGCIIPFCMEYLVITHNNLWNAFSSCLLRDESTGSCIYEIQEFNALEEPFVVDVVYSNISEDCQLLDPANGDWHLYRLSPCIHAGVDAGLNWDESYEQHLLLEYSHEVFQFDKVLEYDFEGEERPYGSAWDIGPDEWWPASE